MDATLARPPFAAMPTTAPLSLRLTARDRISTPSIAAYAIRCRFIWQVMRSP
jgi:hypothetical protein